MSEGIQALEQLLQLRESRRGKIERELLLARGAAEQALREREAASRTLHAHQALRAPQEQCLFDEFVESAGDPVALERYRHGMNALAQETMRLREATLRAERHEAAMATALAEQRQRYAKAVRDVEKFVFLLDEHRERARLATEYREEGEAEEWSTTFAAAADARP